MKTLRALPILFVLILVFSCATVGIDLAKMTPEDLSALAMTTYETRLLEHQKRAGYTNLTQQEKEDLQDLKNSLTEVYPFIKSFNRALDDGISPMNADRQAVMNYIKAYYYRR